MTLPWDIITLVSVAALIFCIIKLASMNKKVRSFEVFDSRNAMYYKALAQWLRNRNKGVKLDEFLKKQIISSIAIYGIGEMGKLLYEELKGTEIKVDYFIDKNTNGYFSEAIGAKVVGLSEAVTENPVDAIIVTPIYDFEEIEGMLLDMGLQAIILSLEDLIYEI